MAIPLSWTQNWLIHLWHKILVVIGGYFTKHPAGDPEKEPNVIIEKFLSQINPNDVFTIILEPLYPIPNIIADFKSGYNPN